MNNGKRHHRVVFVGLVAVLPSRGVLFHQRVYCLTNGIMNVESWVASCQQQATPVK